jgi:hypothetical protein
VHRTGRKLSYMTNYFAVRATHARVNYGATTFAVVGKFVYFLPTHNSQEVTPPCLLAV